MTPEQLKTICPTVKNPIDWSGVLTDILPRYEIDTVNRQAMFIAQCLHETAGFKFLREIWGPTKWQVKYEGHTGLGNTQPGDGKRFMGRGLIQCTGRANYQAFSDWIEDPDVMEHPEKLEEKEYATLSAIWYWERNNLNRFADIDDIKGCTRAVNGRQMLGLEERTKYYERGKQQINLSE